MVHLSHSEAQLFRMLHVLFGREQVVYNVSLACACENQIADKFPGASSEVLDWASQYRCLFVVLDKESTAKMVVEFADRDAAVVDLTTQQHKELLQPILECCKIHYIEISQQEFDAITDASSGLTLVDLIGFKLGIDDLYSESESSLERL